MVKGVILNVTGYPVVDVLCHKRRFIHLYSTDTNPRGGERVNLPDIGRSPGSLRDLRYSYSYVEETYRSWVRIR